MTSVNSQSATNNSHDDAAARPAVTELSYEQARDELITIVKTLEAGQAPLADTLALWERGEELANYCQTWLDGARERLEAARAKDDGE